MLLIDGVKYEEWTPPNEDELEQIVIKHAQDIFGEDSIYFDKKQKLSSLAGVGSIPDGLVIMFGHALQWHIVEVELASHDPYQHVVPQVDRFINAIDYPGTRNKIINALYDMVNDDELLKLKIRQAIGQGKDVHKFLSDLITTPSTVTIIIEKNTDQLKEALKKYPQKKVVEFQTFRRVGSEAVHAHLFEPLYKEIASVRNELTITRDEDIDSSFIFIKVENFWIRYKRLRVASKYLAYLSLSHDSSFELETDVGIIKTKIDKWNEICTGMGKWYKAHPQLKAGDNVTFKVLEPMKKYRLEIVK